MKVLLGAGLAVSSATAFAGAIQQRVVSAPTLSELGLIVLAVAVGIAGGVIVRRRK